MLLQTGQREEIGAGRLSEPDMDGSPATTLPQRKKERKKMLTIVDRGRQEKKKKKKKRETFFGDVGVRCR